MHTFEIRLDDKHLAYVSCDTDEELLAYIKAFRNENPEHGDLSIVIHAAVPYVAYMRQFKVGGDAKCQLMPNHSQD